MTEKFIGADPGIEVGGTRHRRMTPFELLPCPFCGNTDDFEGSPFPNGSHTSWIVRCGVPHCSAELIGETPEDVIDRWNRRIAATKAQTVDGYVLVPLEATPEMSQAAYKAAGSPSDWYGFEDMWAAALSALPKDQ